MIPLHLTSHFFPEYTGTATRLYNILCRLPYPVQLITSNKTMDDKLIEKANDKIDNINIHRASIYSKKDLTSPSIRRMSTIYKYYTLNKLLYSTLNGEKFDLIHAHNMIPFGEAGRKLSRNGRHPFIFEIHGIFEDSNSGISKIFQDQFLIKETGKLARSADRIIALTQSHKEWIAGFYGVSQDKITVLPNGVDVNKFLPSESNKAEAEKIKKAHGIEGKVIMYAGVMDRINGLVSLYDVIPELIKQKPDISYVFIGHGPEENKILELSKKYSQVKFYPMVPYEKMPVYYEMCDIFVIPRPSTLSSETITPLKLLESMSMGKVVLGSNVGGIGEIIKDGDNGFLYQKNDIGDFKQKLFELIDRENRDIMAMARKTVSERYSWDNSSKILSGVYAELTS